MSRIEQIKAEQKKLADELESEMWEEILLPVNSNVGLKRSIYEGYSAA